MADPFHEHLDKCERCRRQAFNLCQTGDALLVAAVLGPAPLPDPTAVARTLNEMKTKGRR